MVDQKTSSLRTVFMAAGCLAALVAILVVVFAPMRETGEPSVGPPPPSEAVAGPNRPVPAAAPGVATDDASTVVPTPGARSTTASIGPDLIARVLGNKNLDFPSVVNELLALVPQLDPDSRAEAAHHIANLSDESTAAGWTAMLVANQIPEPASEVLFNELLNRPPTSTMPALAGIADNPHHPLRQDAIEVLEILYGIPPQGQTWAARVKDGSGQNAQ